MCRYGATFSLGKTGVGLGFPTPGKSFFRLYARQLGCEERRVARCSVCTFMWFLGNGELLEMEAPAFVTFYFGGWPVSF